MLTQRRCLHFQRVSEMAARIHVHAAGKALNHPPVPSEQFFPLLQQRRAGRSLLLHFPILLHLILTDRGRYALDTLIS